MFVCVCDCVCVSVCLCFCASSLLCFFVYVCFCVSYSPVGQDTKYDMGKYLYKGKYKEMYHDKDFIGTFWPIRMYHTNL